MDRAAAESGPRDTASASGRSAQLAGGAGGQGNQTQNSGTGSPAPAALSSSPASADQNTIGFHDGLIPTDQGAFRTSANYPEVVPTEVAVPSGRNSPAVIGEKNYPEVNTTPSIHLEKNYPEVASSAHSHNSHHPHRHSHTRPSASPAPTALSNVHTPIQPGIANATRTSLHAWSEADETRYQEALPPDSKSKPLWKRPIILVIAAAVVIIAVLAGILGAIATGKIKTSGNSSPAASTPSSSPKLTQTISSAPSGQVISLSCPSGHGLNFTSAGNPSKTYLRRCGINFPGGDGTLGKVASSSITSLSDCLERCAERQECVGAVWVAKANPNPECWLKQFIGVSSTANANGIEAGILWQ